VIPEVDSALRAVIEREALHAADVEIVFDAPTKDWAARRTVPTVDVYLYDIREDLRRRERGLINEYDGSRVLARHLPPRYFKLSYLVTAWTQRPEDEHRLLASLLYCFLRHEALPSDVLTGALAELGLPVPVTIALPPPEDRSFADVWSALGGELKPSLDIVISAPTATGQTYTAGPPVREPTAFVLGGRSGATGTNFGEWPPAERRGGRTDGWVMAHASDDDSAGADGKGPSDRGTDKADGVAGRVGGARTSGGSQTSSGSGEVSIFGMTWQQLAQTGAVRIDPPPEAADEPKPTGGRRRRVQVEQRDPDGPERSRKPRAP
jgi:hypothetical protein